MSAVLESESTVPVRWSEVSAHAETVIIVASGPSLIRFPFTRLRDKGFVIAVNDAHKAVPWAHAWVTVDTIKMNTRFPKIFNGQTYAAVPADFGQVDAKFSCDRFPPPPGLQCLLRVDQDGLDEDPKRLSGINSAFGALNFAYHMRPKRIVLFGVDAKYLNLYFYGLRRQTSQIAEERLRRLPELFASAVPQLTDRGISVINASFASAVRCFPRMRPLEALRVLNAAV